jgi:metal-responsive CopG/Arc/MetJ family transcriptional regulator
MDQITLRLPEDALESLEDEATDADVSRSEHLRDVLTSHIEHDEEESHPERVRELEARIDELEQETERLRREKRLILEQRTEHNELIEYVEHERSLQERREDRLDAPVWKRGYWWVFGRGDQ